MSTILHTFYKRIMCININISKIDCKHTAHSGLYKIKLFVFTVTIVVGISSYIVSCCIFLKLKSLHHLKRRLSKDIVRLLKRHIRYPVMANVLPKLVRHKSCINPCCQQSLDSLQFYHHKKRNILAILRQYSFTF